MNRYQLQSDVVSVRRGLNTALAFFVAGVCLLILEWWFNSEENRYFAAALGGAFFLLGLGQLWQCRHELSRLARLLGGSGTL